MQWQPGYKKTGGNVAIKTAGIPLDVRQQHRDYVRYLDALVWSTGTAEDLAANLGATDLIGANKSLGQIKSNVVYNRNAADGRVLVMNFLRWEAAVWDLLVRPHVPWEEYLGLVAYTTQYYKAMNARLRGMGQGKISRYVWEQAPAYTRLAEAAIDRFTSVRQKLFRPGIDTVRRESWIPTSSGDDWNLGKVFASLISDGWIRFEKGFMSTCTDVAWGARAFYGPIEEYLSGANSQAHVGLDALTPFPGEREVLFKPGRTVYINRVLFLQRDGRYRPLYDRFKGVDVLGQAKDLPRTLAELEKETPDSQNFRLVFDTSLGGPTPVSVSERSINPVVRPDFDQANRARGRQPGMPMAS